LNIRVEKFENIALSQTKYITKLLRRRENNNLCDYKTVNTPIVPDKVFEQIDNVEDIKFYKEMIGELLYLANRTRPDIAFITSYLSQFGNRLERHIVLLKRVLQLQGTQEKKLLYTRECETLRVYADSS